MSAATTILQRELNITRETSADRTTISIHRSQHNQLKELAATLGWNVTRTMEVAIEILAATVQEGEGR